MKIRRAQKKDMKEFLALQESYHELYWSRKDFQTALKEKKAIFLVAEEGRKLVGMIIGFFSHTKHAEVTLHETRVLQSKQREGLGKKLVHAFCKEAFSRGAKIIYALIKDEHVPFYVDSCKFKKSDTWIEIKKEKL